LEAGVAWPATPAVAAFVALVAFVAFAAESALAALGTLPSDDSLTSAPLTLSFAEVRAGHLTVADVLRANRVFLISRLSMKPVATP